MDMNNYFNLNNFNMDFMLKLFQDYQNVVNENKILKNSLKISSKPTKKASKPTPKFYLTPKAIKIIEKCVKTLKKIDPISGWFLHLLAISGCRGAEIQKVKMQDITSLLSKTGEIFYNTKVNIAKKEMSLVLEKLSLILKSSRLFKKLTKIILTKKILTQGVLIFSKKPNTNLKITKLILSIFLENLKIFSKDQDFVPINRSIYLETYLFQI